MYYNNKNVSDMVYDSCAFEIVCSNFDLSKTRSSSVVFINQDNIYTILATSSCIGNRCFHSFDISVPILTMDEFQFISNFLKECMYHNMLIGIILLILQIYVLYILLYIIIIIIELILLLNCVSRFS